MTPDMRRLCGAVESALSAMGQHTLQGSSGVIVRAVLNELREPSEAMRAAGQAGHRTFNAMPGARSEYLSSEPYTFAAMIDAILADPP